MKPFFLVWCSIVTQIVYLDPSLVTIIWEKTKGGKTAQAKCPNVPNGAKAYRKCNDDGKWDKADFSKCNAFYRLVWCQKVTHVSFFGIVIWNKAISGQTVQEKCPYGPNGENAYMTCT